MARASFSTLPLELKARIVEMASYQEEVYTDRVVNEAEPADHVDALSSLALVNKELRDLAAVHQFRYLSSNLASKSFFRFHILPRYGHHITKIGFFDHHSKEGAEHALSAAGQLPALRSLSFGGAAARRLFGSGPGATEEASHRASSLVFVGPRIESLVLYGFNDSEAIGLINPCPNLKTLGLIVLSVTGDVTKEWKEIIGVISARARLENLSILLDSSTTRGPPIEALAPLKHDAPPINTLQLCNFPFDQDTFNVVDHFSSTISALTLELGTPSPADTITPLD